MILSTEMILIVFFISLIGALIQGTIGFGLGPLAVPLLALIDPRFIPGPLLMAALLLNLMMFRREHTAVNKPDLIWAMGGRLIGTVAGAGLLYLLSSSDLTPFFAAMVLLAVLISVSGWRIAIKPLNLTAAGLLSGFMGTASSVGGAPMAMLYQNEEGARIRGTLAVIFIFGTTIGLLALLIIGRLGKSELQLGLLLTPGIVGGYLGSGMTRAWLDRGFMRPAILTLSTLLALFLIVRRLF